MRGRFGCAAFACFACGGLTDPGGVPPGNDGSVSSDVGADVVDGSSCGDLLTDPNNCATCGHSCQGGACVGGNCQPVPIPTPGDAFAIALSDTDVVYTSSKGELWRVAKKGGVPQMLGGPMAVSPANVFGLVVLGGMAYEASEYVGVVRIVPLSGGPSQTIPTPAPTSLATNGQDVFIASSQAEVMRMTGGSGPPAPMEPAPTVPPLAFGMTVSMTDVFVSTLDATSMRIIERVSLGAGVGSLGPQTCAAPCPLATDGNHVFSIQGPPNQASVTSSSITGPPGAIALTKDAAYAGIALDDVYVYYAQLQGPCGSPPCKTGIARVKKVFSLPTTLASSGDPIAIALDASSIYFSSATGIGKLAKP